MQPGYKPEPADTFTRFVGKFRSKCWAVGSEWQKKWHRIDDANSFLYENVSGDLTNDTDPSPNYFRLITLLVCYILILFILFVIIIPGVKCYCSIDVPRDRLTFPTTFQSPPLNYDQPILWRLMTIDDGDDSIWIHTTLYSVLWIRLLLCIVCILTPCFC